MNSLIPWMLLSALATACESPLAPPAVPPAARPLHLQLAHLRGLGRDATVAGRAVRVVALYAPAPSYRPAASPARDGSEGVACVDDAARAAVVYLRDFERTRSPASLQEARGLLDFVVAMEQGDGEFLNFLREDGTPNRTAPSSRKGFGYWGARSLWALGEARRVLLDSEPASAERYRAPLDRAAARYARDVAAGELSAGSLVAASEALLGLLAYQRAEPTGARAALAERAAQVLLQRTHTTPPNAPPWGARVEDRGAPTWHAWGARATAALAQAGLSLQRPALVRAAQEEADTLWARALRSQDLIAAIDADGVARAYPQIAYGVSPMVEGLLALADATGEERYARQAGRAARWFLGANVAHVAMYDEASGRTFDGIDGANPVRVNRDAGAESTIEALLALGAVAESPSAAEQLRLPSAPEPEEAAAPVHLTYWPAANPVEVELATRLTDAWNRAHPAIQVRVQPAPAGRSSEEVLLAAIVARSTPDICSNVSAALLARLVRAGGVLALDAFAATAARLAERATDPMLAPLRSPDGHLYALPWKTNPTMMLYNRDLLAAAKVAPPRTHSELLAASARLVADRDGDGRSDRWALWAPVKTTWFERFYDFYPLYLAGSGGATLVHEQQILFDNPAAVAAFAVFQRGFAAGLFPRSNFSGRDPFVDGTVAMKFVGPWFLRELEELKVPGLSYGVAPVPTPDGAAPNDTFAFADLKSVALFATSRHPLEAARFIAYLTSREADRLLIELSAQLPYRRGLGADPQLRAAVARWPALAPFVPRVERSRDLDLHSDVVEILDIVSEAYEASAIYQVLPPQRAVHAAAVEARSLLHVR